MKKRIMIVYIEFFKNQSPEEIERILRTSSERGGFPAFQRMMVSVDHKFLRSRKTIEERYEGLPLIINEEPKLKGMDT